MPNVRELTSANPNEQVWQLLRLFHDIPSTMRRHANVLGLDDATFEKHKKNIEKQARQLAYCVRQAEEYFDAASKVSIATRPTLLYYGVASLAQALVLLKNNGDFSFDRLRELAKHQHHGLELVRGVVSHCTDPVAFFSSLQCNLHFNKHTGKPWGAFPLFYSSLTSGLFSITTQTGEQFAQTIYVNQVGMGGEPINAISTLKSTRFSVFDLIATLPDLALLLHDYWMQPRLFSGHIDATTVHRQVGRNMKLVPEIDYTLDFFLDDRFSGRLGPYLERLIHPGSKLSIIAQTERNCHLRMEFATIDGTASDGVDETTLPTVIHDMTGRQFFVLESDDYLVEPAAIFIISFCLGMLSRYYPDVWMETIDSNILVAELTELLLKTIMRKFPILILDELTQTKHLIHQ